MTLAAAGEQLSTPEHRQFLASLQASLAPRSAPEGSVKRWIDDLVTERLGILGEANEWQDDTQSNCRLLVEHGFPAVPELLAHIDDHRMTRTVRHSADDPPTHFVSVGELTGDLLQELAGDRGRQWERGAPFQHVRRDDAKAWWVAAKQSAEDEYLVRNVLPNRGEGSGASTRRSMATFRPGAPLRCCCGGAR